MDDRTLEDKRDVICKFLEKRNMVKLVICREEKYDEVGCGEEKCGGGYI